MDISASYSPESSYTGYIVAAYAVAGVVMLWLLVGSLIRRSRAKARLTRLERHDTQT